MISNHWRNLRALPPAQSDEYQLVKRNSTMPLSKDEIVDRFAHWNPLVPDLLASPGGRRAFPPVRNLRIRRHANMRMSRTFAVAAMAWLVLGLLAIGIPIARGKAVDGLAFAMLAFAAFFFSEHHALRRRKPLLFERALYFRHVLAAPGALRLMAAVLLALTAVFGLQQWAESQASRDAVLSSWAMIRGDLLARPYTLVTGPLLHGGFTHFANNLLLLAAILPVVVALYPAWRLLLVFLIANAAGGALQLSFGLAGYPAYVGVSAGVFALYMMAVGASKAERRCLPIGLGNALLAAVVISVCLADALSPSAATIAHVVGACIGLLASALANAMAQRKRR